MTTSEPLNWRIILADHPDQIQATHRELLEEILGKENLERLFYCCPSINQNTLVDELHQNLVNLASERKSPTIMPRYSLWLNYHGIENYRELGYTLFFYDYQVYCKAVSKACQQYARSF